MEKIGLIGLGIMGKPMAHNLLKAGVDLTVCGRRADVIRELEEAGARSADYRGIGETCDIIMTILPDGGVVQSVLFGENGVAETIREGSLVCDLSSVTREESRTCYDRLKEKGAGFVDAPVSGGETGAIAGTLAIMCGGDEEDYNRLLPYFDILGSSSMLIGPCGSGSIAKLANQIIVNLNICAVSEALVLAAKAGVDPMKVYQAIRGGMAGSAVLDAKAPMICARNFTPGAKISINHKDIRNVLAAAHDLDVPLPFTAQLFEILQTLRAHGHMNDDHGAYVQYFEALAGVEVKSDITE